MNRKQRRERQKQLKKLNNQPELEQKLGLFDRLPDLCLSCHKPFNKKDKTMVTTWSVVVREQKGVVRLYCPDCWKKATNIVRDIEK